ncbi:MAG: metal ABC transporter substrate-binding protein [Alphaproteobacteria bacterium]|nr:metal ABC transporter substrate-binding protein [Alphaproteobacteria bacterium]
MLRRTVLSAPLILLARRAPAQQPPSVIASFSILADMTRQVGGDRITLRAIVGPDQDAHGFQPKPSDAAALTNAALVIRNGLGFEGWLDRMIRSSGYKGALVTATDGIVPRMMEAHHHHHGHDHGGAGRRHNHSVGPRRVPDPHAWQDLGLAQRYLHNITAGLIAADPGNEAHYRRNAEAYAARLMALDQWVRAEVAKVPAARRKIVTSHDAFGYFGEAYGIRFLAPQGVSTEAEPSAAEVGRLIRQIKAENITALFMENMSNPATLQRIAQETGLRVRGRLFADALSSEAGPAPTYEAMFRHNIALMVLTMREDTA